MNIDDILSVDATPLSSISTSGPDMSVAMSVELDTSLAVDFDDRRCRDRVSRGNMATWVILPPL